MESKMTYIIENVNDISIEYRQIVARMIYDSGAKLKETGSGLSINESGLSDQSISEIYDFIKLKIDDGNKILNSFALSRTMINFCE
jgi:hypothetical protein